MRGSEPQRVYEVERQRFECPVVDMGVPPRLELGEERAVEFFERVVVGPVTQEDAGAGAITADPAQE